MCRRNRNFLKQECCQKVLLVPNIAIHTQKPNEGSERTTNRLVSTHRDYWDKQSRETSRMRKQQAEPTRMTDVQQMNEIPCCIFKENFGCRLPRNRFSAFFWSTLARFHVASNRGDYDIIIGTDSNSHSMVWNCSLTNKRGELLGTFLIYNNLFCCNIGNNPTFINGSGHSSIIYLTLANYRLSQCVSNWHVEQVLHSSDHYCVLFTVNNCYNFRIPPAETWNYRNGMWSNFKSQLELGLKNWTCPRFWTNVSIEQKLKKSMMR